MQLTTARERPLTTAQDTTENSLRTRGEVEATPAPQRPRQTLPDKRAGCPLTALPVPQASSAPPPRALPWAYGSSGGKRARGRHPAPTPGTVGRFVGTPTPVPPHRDHRETCGAPPLGLCDGGAERGSADRVPTCSAQGVVPINSFAHLHSQDDGSDQRTLWDAGLQARSRVRPTQAASCFRALPTAGVAPEPFPPERLTRNTWRLLAPGPRVPPNPGAHSRPRPLLRAFPGH